MSQNPRQGGRTRVTILDLLIHLGLAVIAGTVEAVVTLIFTR
ncbi:hypothetical protein ABZ454_34145 [Streptomyces sp. NPDC005803]